MLRVGAKFVRVGVGMSPTFCVGHFHCCTECERSGTCQQRVSVGSEVSTVGGCRVRRNLNRCSVTSPHPPAKVPAVPQHWSNLFSTYRGVYSFSLLHLNIDRGTLLSKHTSLAPVRIAEQSCTALGDSGLVLTSVDISTNYDPTNLDPGNRRKLRSNQPESGKSAQIKAQPT